MATIAKSSLLSSSYSASMFLHNESAFSSPCTFMRPLISKKARVSSLKLQANDQSCCLLKDMDTDLDSKKTEKIQEIHCSEEYDKGVRFSGQKLVIAHFSASHYGYNSKIEQFMEEQCGVSNEIKFLYVTANESEKTRQLCRRENIDKIPYFVFYRKTEKIHEVAGFQPKKLVDDILYYRDDPLISHVVQLKSEEDLEKLIKVHKFDCKLIVLNVGKNRCLPCVKIYPSVVKLASQMAGNVVFARMNADENDWCMGILRGMDVRRAPAFLFFENGELCGRYVGSSMSALIREIVKLRREQRASAFPTY